MAALRILHLDTDLGGDPDDVCALALLLGLDDVGLVGITTNLEDGDVLFIDEIHRIARPAEELLYMAMEDFRIDVVVGKGPGSTAIPLDVPPFTLVGATTRTGMITGPLRDRFGLVARLDYYDDAELQAIVVRAAGILDVTIDAASIDTPSAKLTGELAGDKWFDAKQFPSITFKSTKVVASGKDHAKVTGDLTLHGVTKPVTLDVAFLGADAVDPARGVGEPTLEETAVKERVAARARRVAVLADSSKLAGPSAPSWARLPGSGTLVTDADAPGDLDQRCAQAGVTLIRAADGARSGRGAGGDGRPAPAG